MSIDATTYTGLVTSEHNARTRFMAMVAATVQPFVDTQNVYGNYSNLFDLDKAVGDQLDKIGFWIGGVRKLVVVLPNVYFSFDTAGLGWDQANWFGPGSSLTGLTVLPDDAFLTYLKAIIASNNWDGTVPGAYSIYAIVFANKGYKVLIQDNQDMTMTIIFLSPTPIDAVLASLIRNGYITVRPAGVLIAGYLRPTTLPVFGFDIQNSIIAGWDVGNWLQTTTI